MDEKRKKTLWIICKIIIQIFELKEILLIIQFKFLLKKQTKKQSKLVTTAADPVHEILVFLLSNFSKHFAALYIF